MGSDQKSCSSCSNREDQPGSVLSTAPAQSDAALSLAEVPASNITVRPQEALLQHRVSNEVLAGIGHMVEPFRTQLRRPYSAPAQNTPRGPSTNHAVDFAFPTFENHAAKQENGLSGPHYLGNTVLRSGPLRGMALSDLGIVSLIEPASETPNSPHLPPPPFPPIPPPGFPILPGTVDEWHRLLEEFGKKMKEWQRLVKAILSRHSSEARDWIPSTDPRQKLPAHPEDYTEPPETYPETGCPYTYHSSSHVQDTVLLDFQEVTVEWTQFMAAAWDDTGDPYGSPIPRPTPEELRRRYGASGHKPSVNAVTAAVRDYLKQLADKAAELNTLATLPAGLKAFLEQAARGAAGKCPGTCPVRDVQLVGWDIKFGCYTEELFFNTLLDKDKDGVDDTWTVKVTVELWCQYKGKIFYDVTCNPGT